VKTPPPLPPTPYPVVPACRADEVEVMDTLKQILETDGGQRDAG
jgi:hypothetical protein